MLPHSCHPPRWRLTCPSAPMPMPAPTTTRARSTRWGWREACGGLGSATGMCALLQAWRAPAQLSTVSHATSTSHSASHSASPPLPPPLLTCLQVKQQRTLDANQKALKAAEKKAQAQLKQVGAMKRFWLEFCNSLSSCAGMQVATPKQGDSNKSSLLPPSRRPPAGAQRGTRHHSQALLV